MFRFDQVKYMCHKLNNVQQICYTSCMTCDFFTKKRKRKENLHAFYRQLVMNYVVMGEFGLSIMTTDNELCCNGFEI